MSELNDVEGALDVVEHALLGEPARFIGYGAAVVIVLVVALANQLGFTRFGANIDLVTALGLAGGAIAAIVGVIESIRKFVFSPNTVEAILNETDGDTT